MAKGGDKWWLTILVALGPALIAGWFSLRAIDKANESSAQADKTSGELTIAYDLMKQSLEVVQHEADADRDALQKTNELLVQLLQSRRSPHHTEADDAHLLAAAQDLHSRLNAPPTTARPQFPADLHQLWLQKMNLKPSPAP